MFLDDSSADPQTQPRSLALGLCRVKGVHNFSQVLLGDADAGVGEFDNHACRITGAGRHADRNSSTLRHCVGGVRKDVQEQLAQLLAVGADRERSWEELFLNL